MSDDRPDGLPAFVIVWDPAVLSPEDYADLVVALGNIVRASGGLGVERLGGQTVIVSPPPPTETGGRKSMTVGELIEKLKGFDPDLPVLVPGFDAAGLDDLDDVKIVHYIPGFGSPSTGDHVEAEPGDPEARPAVGIGF